jgi:hypothetical protein
MHITLDHIHAKFERVLESGERILRRECRTAAMRDNEWSIHA